MPRPNRRFYEDVGLTPIERKTIQAARQAGDGTPAHASATWGSINGTLTDQADLKEVTDDLEAKATLGDDGY